MKYLKRINESLNYKTLTKEEVIDLLKKNCQKFLSNFEKYKDSLIYRKDSKVVGDFALVNPKLSTSDRIAPYSPTNFHNLLISNLDSWKGWPRRNKSLIFASERRAVSHGGNWVYVVIPFDRTKVATGDRSDFWDCFGKLPNRVDFCGHGIAYYITSLVRDLKIEPEVDTNWEKLKSALETAKMDERMIQKYFKVSGRIMWNSNRNLLENLNKLLDPKSNNFKLGDVISTMHLYARLDPDDEDYSRRDLESWCEDEVILIKVDVLDTILNEI